MKKTYVRDAEKWELAFLPALEKVGPETKWWEMNLNATGEKAMIRKSQEQKASGRAAS